MVITVRNQDIVTSFNIESDTYAVEGDILFDCFISRKKLKGRWG